MAVEKILTINIKTRAELKQMAALELQIKGVRDSLLETNKALKSNTGSQEANAQKAAVLKTELKTLTGEYSKLQNKLAKMKLFKNLEETI